MNVVKSAVVASIASRAAGPAPKFAPQNASTLVAQTGVLLCVRPASNLARGNVSIMNALCCAVVLVIVSLAKKDALESSSADTDVLDYVAKNATIKCGASNAGKKAKYYGSLGKRLKKVPSRRPNF